MASSMPHHQRPMDPRKRWNSNHQGDNDEAEDGEVPSFPQPQQHQQQHQQSRHGHPKFRHRFQPPPQATSPGPAPLPPQTTQNIPQNFQQRFQPPPPQHPPPPPQQYPPPPQSQYQSKQKENDYSRPPPQANNYYSRTPPHAQANDYPRNDNNSEYYGSRRKGNDYVSSGYNPVDPRGDSGNNAVDPRSGSGYPGDSRPAMQKSAVPSSSPRIHDSSGPPKNRLQSGNGTGGYSPVDPRGDSGNNAVEPRSGSGYTGDSRAAMHKSAAPSSSPRIHDSSGPPKNRWQSGNDHKSSGGSGSVGNPRAAALKSPAPSSSPRIHDSAGVVPKASNDYLRPPPPSQFQTQQLHRPDYSRPPPQASHHPRNDNNSEYFVPLNRGGNDSNSSGYDAADFRGGSGYSGDPRAASQKPALPPSSVNHDSEYHVPRRKGNDYDTSGYNGVDPRGGSSYPVDPLTATQKSALPSSSVNHDSEYHVPRRKGNDYDSSASGYNGVDPRGGSSFPVGSRATTQKSALPPSSVKVHDSSGGVKNRWQTGNNYSGSSGTGHAVDPRTSVQKPSAPSSSLKRHDSSGSLRKRWQTDSDHNSDPRQATQKPSAPSSSMKDRSSSVRKEDDYNNSAGGGYAAADPRTGATSQKGHGFNGASKNRWQTGSNDYDSSHGSGYAVDPRAATKRPVAPSSSPRIHDSGSSSTNRGQSGNDHHSSAGGGSGYNAFESRTDTNASSASSSSPKSHESSGSLKRRWQKTAAEATRMEETGRYNYCPPAATPGRYHTAENTPAALASAPSYGKNNVSETAMSPSMPPPPAIKSPPGNGYNSSSGGYATDPRTGAEKAAFSMPGHDSNGLSQNRRDATAAATREETGSFSHGNLATASIQTHQATTAGYQSTDKLLAAAAIPGYDRGDFEPKMPPAMPPSPVMPPPTQPLSAPIGAPPNFAKPPPTPPSATYPTSYENQLPVSRSNYPEQQQRHSLTQYCHSAPTAAPPNFAKPPQTPPSPAYRTSHENQQQPSFGEKNHAEQPHRQTSPSLPQHDQDTSEPVGSDNEYPQDYHESPTLEQQSTPPQSSPPPRNVPPKPPPNPEAKYTNSLHWRNSTLPTKPAKRPTALPNDVEHITEVEWADDSEPAATHAPRYASHCTNVPSLHTNLEKAPRPKLRRPERCFCEPDLVMQMMCCVDTSCALFACQEECTNSCAAGPLCGNKRITRKQWKKLSVFDAGLKGRGLMVQQPCRAGDFIVEYVGVAVKKQYLDGLFARYKSERMLYIMALDNDTYIDARHRGGIARYINHSCEPNCAVHRWKVRGILRAGVFALRKIDEGEELSFDYQWERKRGRAVTKCHCGSVNCRGTIEEAKVGLEAELDDLYMEEEVLEGCWLEMGPDDAFGNEIMNRVVKVYFEHTQDNGEFYIADVAQFDERTGKHLLMYRGDSEEHWTELSQEKWMLLDDGSGVGRRNGYAIARKNPGGGGGAGEPSLIVNPPPNLGLSSNVTSPRSDFSGASSPLLVPGKAVNYMYIQTPVKDQMVAKHTLFKCAQYCRVHIDTVNISVPPGCEVEDDEEDIEGLQKAFDRSMDGQICKLVVTGMEVKKAIDWLEKIAVSIYNSQNGIETPILSTLPSRGSKSALIGTTISTASPAPFHTTEVIIPRIIVDEVKKKYFTLKGYCYNTEVSFSHSDSKSKQFAKMTLSAEVRADLERALEYLNTELTQMCLLAGAPTTSIGVYKDLGFLAGQMSADDFRHLFLLGRRSASKTTTECSEDLRGSTFAKSFEEANRCSIWVQAEEDMGRVSHNRIINEADPNKPRKIYFGVAPSRIDTLWGYLMTRIADLTRGVQFLHLGPDRIYQHALMEPIKKNGRPGNDWNYFFDFVEKTSGASVRIDPITGSSHLRIDGGNVNDDWDLDSQQVNSRIEIAMELISLQIELFRDHHIRKQRWGFGRDWALLLESDHVNLAKNANLMNTKSGEVGSTLMAQDGASKPASTADSLRLSDPRAIGTACLEISEMVTGSGLSEKVAAHACIIFYRYINLLLPSSHSNVASTATNDIGGNNSTSLNTSFKLRDIQLASLFIANKSQKVVKWKRLEAVLEHAYRVFYPGSVFQPESEEAKNWERRVIKAEKTVLTALNYDVFWRGVDWVINAVVGTKAMAEPLAENAMALALSGHVLAAGPMLWLKYGPKYAFAAISGFLSIDIEPLFPALSLQPLTVSHAAELIYHSCQALSRVKKSVSLQSKHELFSDSNSLMGKNVQQVQKTCATYMSKHQGRSGKPIDDSKFISSPAYKEISERAKMRRVFRGVRSDKIEERILPVLGKICFESKCTVRFSDGMLEGTNDIVLEGSWKALSIAEQLLCEVASLPAPVPFDQSAAQNAMLYSALAGIHAPRHDLRNPPGESSAIKQVKIQPGLLDMKKIDGKHGWHGTFDNPDSSSSLNDGAAEDATYDSGWKTCVAANAPQEHLDAAGLRWWVPHQYGPSLSGSLCEIFSSPKLIRGGKVDMRALAQLAQSFAGGYKRLQRQYPALSKFLSGKEGGDALEGDGVKSSNVVAISLQRWPPEKIEMKERSTSSGQNGGMQMGFSVAALQEMQLLHQLHFLIPSPQGHPNFILPLAIALDSESGRDGNNDDDKNLSSSASAALLNTGSATAAAALSGITSNNKAANDILAMIERNQRAAGKRQLVSGSHLVLEPTPINLQKVMSQYQRKNNGGMIIPPAVLASWCHDMLSAILFCHSNHIVLRSLLPDQIHLDHSGTAKLSGLSKVMVLHGKDRTKEFDPLKFVRSKKGKSDYHHSTEDVEPFAAPELLLGGTRHTKETDMWAFGALLANILLGKQLFPGKDRVSKMTQVFKIVGVPDKDNYERAKRFPFYSNNMYVIGEEGKKKKYSRGVEKATRHMLKAFVAGTNGGDHHHQPFDHECFSGLISLIDSLLHLDPKRRMTADGALRHQYMVNHIARVERQEFRKEYVRDWLDLKENVLTKGRRKTMSPPISMMEQLQGSESTPPTNMHGRNGGDSMTEKELKRKAFLIGASTPGGSGGADDGDDLYNLDDLLGDSGPDISSLSLKKKPRYSGM